MTKLDVCDPAVRAVFEGYPAPVRAALASLRATIIDVAARTPGVGPLSESLKWGQPAYRPAKSGVTVRIDAAKGTPGAVALYVPCQTSLTATFRDLYPNAFEVLGSRELRYRAGAPPPRAALEHCIALALTYHAGVRSRSRPGGRI